MPDRQERLWVAAGYAERDVPGILALIRAYYGDIDTASEAFFRWQYEANPSGRVVLQVARHRDDGSVMGQHVLLPMGASVNGRDVPSVLSFNALVDPAYHKQGIWSGLGDACNAAARDQGVAFSYGIPNPNSRVPMVKRLQYLDLGEVDLWVRVARAGPVAAVAGPGWARPATTAAIAAARPVLFRPEGAPRGWEVRRVDAFGPEFNALYDGFRRRYPVMIRRDAAHLNWRYRGVPGRDYDVFAAYRDGTLGGYAIFRRTVFREVDSGMLMDLAGTDADAELAAVVHGATALSRAGVAAFFAYLVPGVAEARVLARAGFRRPPAFLKPQPFPLLVLPWKEDPALDPIRRLDAWYFTIGDYDVF